MTTAAEAPSPLAIRLLWAPHKPEPKQHAFLLLDELEVLEALYGGAAGGGKSDALLMGALRYVDVPGYAALLLRRTYADLAKPGALMDRAKAWLAGAAGVRWSERDFRFTFPSGATLSFGYLQTSTDRYNYQSAEYQFVGFDELTQFEEADYRYLFSRLRRPELTGEESDAERHRLEALTRVPIRMRGASNPGGRGHAWVKRRFIERLPDPDDDEDTLERARRRIFIPATLADNPHVDRTSYLASLANLGRVERARLERGDWDADDGDRLFRGADVRAAVEYGEELDALAAAGELPPPADAPAGGIDFGEHTAALLGIPLEGGGMYVAAGEELVGREPSAAADLILERVFAYPLEELVAWPRRRKLRDPVQHVAEVRYDAAGAQSIRTFARVARVRHPRLRTEAIAFNAYKRETIGYLRWLLERVGAGERVGVLAISPRAAELARQLPELPKDPKDPELPLKGDDHGPDALIALLAPIAARNRDRGRLDRQRATAKAQAGRTVGPRNRP